VISEEPIITVGIIDHSIEVHGFLNDEYVVNGVDRVAGEFSARPDNGFVLLNLNGAKDVRANGAIKCVGVSASSFSLKDVAIGSTFHWERNEEQTFRGNLRLVCRNDGTLTVINEIPVEDYLESVISSEMNADAPIEFLKAHAVVSRSWLVAMLERIKEKPSIAAPRAASEGQIVRWYDREDHDIFDVCADDHCQRYHGITKILSDNVRNAVAETRGMVIVNDGKVCDARFSKACGGFTEEYETAWEEKHVPYLESISDSAAQHPRLNTEQEVEEWILSNPNVYCNVANKKTLQQILPSFDLETTNFFRWAIEYQREELEEIIRTKSGIDFGILLDLVPVQRGPSGRIVKLKIHGSKRTIVVGKELEIRRWLSESHLYSSAFIVMTERDDKNVPRRFLIYGAGWGHGVGMCQIGAAAMATKGCDARTIVNHYFPKANIMKLY